MKKNKIIGIILIIAGFIGFFVPFICGTALVLLGLYKLTGKNVLHKGIKRKKD
jgi:uncharacterized protein YqgC (DUF456 family)